MVAPRQIFASKRLPTHTARMHTCRDDLDALRAIDKALSRGRGRPKNVDNVHIFSIDERPSGNARQRALRRLRIPTHTARMHTGH